MLKHLFSALLLLLLPALLLASCSLPSAPPASVTDPAVRGLYASALAGDGDALYRVSRMYGQGSHGFPQSSWYASIALDEAAGQNHPQAVYDIAVRELRYVRDRVTSYHARNDSFADWADLEDELLEVRRDVARAGTLGDARAKATLAAVDEDIARYHELSNTVRAHYVKCRRCNGEGMCWQRKHHPQGGKEDEREEYTRCRRCQGKGFVEW